MVDLYPPAALAPIEALEAPAAPQSALDAAVASVISPLTKEAYLRHIRRFLADLADMDLRPEEANHDDLLRWWSSQRTLGLRPSTVNQRVAAVRRFYREGARRGLFPENVAEGLPSLRTSKTPQGRALDASEARVLVDACPASGSLCDLRDRLVVSFLLLTGCRVSELRTVTVEDLRTERGHRLVRLRRKGGGEDEQKVVPELALLIDAWAARAGVTAGRLVRRIIVAAGTGQTAPDVPLSRRSLHAIVKARAAAAGLGNDVGPHDLRKTYITACGEQEVPIARTAAAVAHSDPSTTMRYDHQRGMLDEHPSDAVALWLRAPTTERTP